MGLAPYLPCSFYLKEPKLHGFRVKDASTRAFCMDPLDDSPYFSISIA
jgi:hypothetical protein